MSQGKQQENESMNKNQEQEEQSNPNSEAVGNEQNFFQDDEGDEQNLMDEQQDYDDKDMASSDSQLQVENRDHQQMNKSSSDDIKQDDDPMNGYYQMQDEILQWLHNNPGQKWVDVDFPCSSSQFYQDVTNIPDWGIIFKNLQWKRPQEICKDPKFMIVQDEKYSKNVEIDIKQGLFAASWFIGALAIIGTKFTLIEKLIIEKQYFDKGFVSFQFFKNGKWIQIIVDTILPYQKQQNNRICLFSSCSNSQQFWIQLMQKAYVKLHKNYQRICRGNILEGMVDLTGGVSESVDIQHTYQNKIDQINHYWGIIYNYYSQKFFIGSIRNSQESSARHAQQGQQGILQNHYYSIIDMRDYPKDNVKLIRIRNFWGSQGIWTGPFCEQADDWQKYKAIKQDVKNSIRLKKSDGSWWMNFNDFLLQFERIVCNKIFPQNWEIYSIQGQWSGKTNGGKCPIFIGGDKTIQGKQTVIKAYQQYHQMQTDDRWFNNPQFRIKINKDIKIYISLMQQDQKITGQIYVPCSFLIIHTKSKNQRLWQRPSQNSIIAEINSNGNITNQRQITQYFLLKKIQKTQGIYIIIPNIVETKDHNKKEDGRKFYLRLFASDKIDVTQLPQTYEKTVDGQWTQYSAGGSRRIEIKQDGMGKKKGEIKDNPKWCKNPQYFLSIKQPTMLKIILRKSGAKKYKGWKIGMTVCRYEIKEQKKIEKEFKKDKKNQGQNLQRLLQQTNQYLEPPTIKDVERKLLINLQEKFKQSIYCSEEVSALYFKWNPTQGPFIIIPSSDGEDRIFNYKMTIFSNHPVQLSQLDEVHNQVVVSKWQKDISAGGCHLNQNNKDASQRTWSMNPKFHLSILFDEFVSEEPIPVRITLTIAEKNWKKINPNTVNGMIGLYLLQKKQGKIIYCEQTVVAKTTFVPMKQIVLQVLLGQDRLLNKNGYLIMPSTYQSKVQGAFILSVKCQKNFELLPYK